MEQFNIEFIYQDRTYKATVTKKLDNLITYFALIHQLHDFNFEHALKFEAIKPTQMHGYTDHPAYPDLPGLVAFAIIHYCESRKIEIFKK